ncbi:type II and III secretion system protein family protein [Bradyrhizobium sp. PMVTL-01]|uniref:type II and III secretion system protein family protein n=1 Tax=Bradyrhizobium sp. PMVTL-01 TaxID=3434999 RepID=UPI003F7051B0
MSGRRIARKEGGRLPALGVFVLGAVLAALGTVDGARAAERGSSSGVFVSEMGDVQRVKVIVNKSRTFRVDTAFSTIVSGSPDIAEVRSLSDHVIYVQGKQAGSTNVILFDSSMKQIGILDVDVVEDTGNLQRTLQQTILSTGTSGIRVTVSPGQVILNGTAADAVAAERAASIASSTVPKDWKVVNALNVASPQQVMLEVRFLEVSRAAGRELGVNLHAGNGSLNQVGQSGTSGPPIAARTPQGVPLVTAASGLIGTATQPFGNLLTNVLKLNNGTSVDLFVQALEEKGLVRRLAEPNLMALSGDAARFLAGGEFPVPVASNTTNGFPTTTIEFKKFGVELGFVPTVLSRGVINLRVEPSVSELDFTNAVQIQGTTVPALTSRNARTTVELRDGQSFAIAGLLQTRNTQEVQQLPWIGSVPVLGALFRSASYQQRETDLVIIVTPRLVAPAAPGQQLASPLDSRLPANDVDFFLNGQMEVKKRYNDYVNSGGDLKGPYGHIIAPDVRLPAPAVAVDQPVVKTLN